MSKLLLKISLLSVSFLLLSSYCFSVTINDYKKVFVDYSEASVELLVTITMFAVTFMIIIAEPVAKLLGKKNSVMLGLIIITISAFFTFFAQSYIFVLLSRIFYGVGLGLITTLAISMVSDFYQGDEAAKVMGYRGACEDIGQSLTVAIAGFLYAYLGFKYVSFVYLIALPIAISFYLYIPNDKHTNSKNIKAIKTKKEFIIPWNVLPFCLILLFTVNVSIGLFLKIFDLLNNANLESQNNASVLLTVFSICITIGGALFGPIYIKIKYYTLALALILSAICYIILAFCSSLYLFYLAIIIGGLAYPLIISYFYNMIGPLSTKISNVIITSCMLVGCSTGGSIAPLTFSLLQKSLNNASSNSIFLLYSVSFLIIFVISFILKKRFSI